MMKTDCCCPTLTDAAACGCCEGVEPSTPLPTANRPGLPELSYRIGTHASFLESMLARLSSSDYRELKALATRETDDPAIALLDAWATVADVLTFYQERIANEGYLRTATERRSVLELARLVGYQPRPGVASSVYLAYTLDNNSKDEVVIPKGAKSQSIPGPGEMPQTFETSEDLKARAQWNNLKPRMTKPQTPKSIRYGNGTNQQIYLKGISTNLKPNDPFLIRFSESTEPEFFRIQEVITDAAANRTLVILQKPTVKQDALSEGYIGPLEFDSLRDIVNELAHPPSIQQANALKLRRDVTELFLGNTIAQQYLGHREGNTELLRKALTSGDASHAVLKSFKTVLHDKLVAAVVNANVAEENPIKTYALRVKASLFGHNALKEPQYEPILIMSGGEFSAPIPNPDPNAGNLKPQKEWSEWEVDTLYEKSNILYLNRRYDEILPKTYGVILKPDQSEPQVFNIENVQDLSRNAYGISGETTKITLNEEWWTPTKEKKINELRTTTVYIQSEELPLAEEPIGDSICGGEQEVIELDGLYDGLESGRWVIVSGERDHLPGTSGVHFSEAAMLSSVSQDVRKSDEDGSDDVLAGDKMHSFIKLDKKLEYCFKRNTVTIHGNVVKATHGETRKEVLGGGDASKSLQAFTLKQPPLTYVPASNPSGVDSTLKVYVNDIQWHEADSLAGLSPVDRSFTTKTDNESKTTVIFGNGKQGARLPTGIENIRAEYRNGIGQPGNVKAEQISLLTTRPLGVREVINPLRASGGADRESRDQARKHAPLAVKALDRLVSVQDYEDFTRVFAGIGKACAVEISDGRRQLVHITIAGADDIPIDDSSDLYHNLLAALRKSGDPRQAIQVAIRELMLIVISAEIRILPDYQWEPVVTEVRAALLDAFSFEHRELGQDVYLSEVISVIQNVRGVGYVDVDTLGGIPEKENGQILTPAQIAKTVQQFVGSSPQNYITVNLPQNTQDIGSIQPAQLAFLSPDVPETLILNQKT